MISIFFFEGLTVPTSQGRKRNHCPARDSVDIGLQQQDLSIPSKVLKLTNPPENAPQNSGIAEQSNFLPPPINHLPSKSYTVIEYL